MSMRIWMMPLVAVMTMALACGYKHHEPVRPKGVPHQTLWIGGPDGGVFAEVQPVPSRTDTYMMTIYNDRTGAVLYSGLTEAHPTGRGSVAVRDARAFSGWDGEKMILTDGRTLQPTKGTRPRH
jgi:hypothetical protein